MHSHDPYIESLLRELREEREANRQRKEYQGEQIIHSVKIGGEKVYEIKGNKDA